MAKKNVERIGESQGGMYKESECEIAVDVAFEGGHDACDACGRCGEKRRVDVELRCGLFWPPESWHSMTSTKISSLFPLLAVTLVTPLFLSPTSRSQRRKPLQAQYYCPILELE